MRKEPEPWMRGPIEGVSALVAPLLYSFQMAREDLAHYTEGLSEEQLWAQPFGLASTGFHIRHIAGSTDRLLTYLRGEQLSAGQLAALERENAGPVCGRAELLDALDRVFTAVEATVRALDPGRLADARAVGRKKLPTTVAGLLTHMAEHTQRHVGQAISAAKLVRACA
jgi:uncharacterized damage-inducible protein DinB